MKINKKNKLLILGFFFGLIVTYYLGFSKTLHYYNAYQKNNALLNENEKNPEIIKILLEKDRQLDKALEKYHFEGETSFQNILLKNLNLSLSNKNIKIINFKEEHVFKENGVATLSYFFTLEGTFNTILKTISEIENKPYLGTVKHIAVNKKFNYKKEAFYLHVDVIIQRTFDE
jgi:hypothetical protein